MADDRDPGVDQPTEERRYDRWSYPQALSRRGYVLAVLVPLLIAAVGFGAVVLLASDDSGEGTVVRVPTSDWLPGQPSGTTRIDGQLASDERHCVYVDTADGQEIWPVWPAGYTARVDDQGRVSIYDGGDRLVAREGQRLQATGTLASSSGYAGESCLPDDGQVAIVQSEVAAQ